MLVAYVSFNGNTEEAFNFYKSALGGNITNVQHFGDSPDGGQMADADKKDHAHCIGSSCWNQIDGKRSS